MNEHIDFFFLISKDVKCYFWVSNFFINLMLYKIYNMYNVYNLSTYTYMAIKHNNLITNYLF